jgi:hypothetical protein
MAFVLQIARRIWAALSRKGTESLQAFAHRRDRHNGASWFGACRLMQEFIINLVNVPRADQVQEVHWERATDQRRRISMRSVKPSTRGRTIEVEAASVHEGRAELEALIPEGWELQLIKTEK